MLGDAKEEVYECVSSSLCVTASQFQLTGKRKVLLHRYARYRQIFALGLEYAPIHAFYRMSIFPTFSVRTDAVWKWLTMQSPIRRYADVIVHRMLDSVLTARKYTPPAMRMMTKWVKHETRADQQPILPMSSS